MSQYRTGTATVTNGSATVTGSGTLWLANVSANDLFVVSGVSYFVSGVSTNTSLTLTAPYAGTTGGGKSYVIHRDFATILGVSVPLMQDGDLETVAVYNRMVQAMYTAYGSTPNGTAATADVTTSATDTTAGRLLKVGDFGLGNSGVAETTADLNDINFNSFQRIASSSVNRPFSWGTILTQVPYGDDGIQIAGNTQVDELCFRRKVSDTWESWQEIYHTGSTFNNIPMAAGQGIDFSAAGGSAAGSTSAVLDDYEEGTFTPSLTFGGANVGMVVNSSTTKGSYTKIGNQVTVHLFISLTDKGSSVGVAVIDGLPFTSNFSYSAGAVRHNRIENLGTVLVHITDGQASIAMSTMGLTGTAINMDNDDWNNNSNLMVTMTYRTA